MTLFLPTKFTSAAGLELNWKVECDALTDEDWGTLALMASQMLLPFGSVEGVPRGGLKFAEALRQYVTEGPLLIADDVLTTGLSMERHRAGRDAVGVVVFNRSRFYPDWVRPLWILDWELST